MAETPNFKEAQRITIVDSHTYSGHVPKAWSGYGVAQGGFTLGLLTCAARAHMQNTHSSLRQPHTIQLQAQFLRPTPQGHVRFSITDTKLGRTTSTLHITILNPSNQPTIVAYVVQGTLSTGRLPSVPNPMITSETGYLSTLPFSPPKGSTKDMLADHDPNWRLLDDYDYGGEYSKFGSYHAMLVARSFSRSNPQTPSSLDRWFRLDPSLGQWTEGALPFIGDIPFVPILDHGRSHDEIWMATTSYTIDVKKQLPEEGVEWLLARTSSPVVRAGRADFNTVVVDEEGEIVALVTMVYTIVKGSQRAGKKELKL